MDWPVIGAVSAAVIVAGAVTFEVVVFVQSNPTPVKRAPQLVSYGSSVERSANEIPGCCCKKSTVAFFIVLKSKFLSDILAISKFTW